ncbi:MAG: thioesterase family protein [Propionibacteriaceae bacterium]|jgi:acyl-CoA thioester hydrolase|nr:thioesterase family protein [Propionibacteriaceae bacterium]
MTGVFVADVQLRWTDLDAQGHVNNVMVADYLQQARAEFMLSGDAGEMIEDGVVVVAHQISYRNPIHYSDDPLRAELWVAEVGAARLVIAYRLIQDDSLCVEARTVLCPYDFERMVPRRLTRRERGFFTAWLDENTAPLPELVAPELAGRGKITPVQVRWSDPDRYQHVNNVRYLDYVLAGRVDMTSHADPSMARVAMGNADAARWLIARQDIDYLVQMMFRLEPFHVLTAPVHLGTSSIVLATEIVDPDDGIVHAKARTVLVCADEAGHKRPLPDAARAALEKLLTTQ